MRPVKISPSLFAADLGTFTADVRALEESGADMLHIDVMDGHFVERMAFGADHIRMIRALTHLPLDVHLMITEPERHIAPIAAAGADVITVHTEATVQLARCLQLIHAAGKAAGAVLSPATSEDALHYVLDDVEMILLMTVNPGAGGQHFLTSVVEKIHRVKELVGTRDIDIEVDGSIDDTTIVPCRKAGANVFVSGGYLFQDIRANMAKLRKAAV